MYASALSGREQRPSFARRKPTLHGSRRGFVLSDLWTSTFPPPGSPDPPPVPPPPPEPATFVSWRDACASGPPFLLSGPVIGERRSWTSALHFGVGEVAVSFALLHASSSPLTRWISFSL